MSLDAFQSACLVVLLVAYAAGLRQAPERARYALECAVLAIAAWAGEETCIRLYRFYAYAEGWWLPLGHVPVVVVLIWPQVVQSARAVVREVWPQARGPRALAALGALVVLDASLMEVLAVAGGLWTWAEPGYLGVPLIGILGWASFAVAIVAALERLEPARRRPGTGLAVGAVVGAAGGAGASLATLGLAVVLAVVLAVLLTHALLLASWWGALRWVLRGDLGGAAVVAFAALPGALAWAAGRGGGRLGGSTLLARLVAASVFFALLATLRSTPRFPALLAHTGLVALPYLVATFTSPGWRPRRRGPGRRSRATAAPAGPPA